MNNIFLSSTFTVNLHIITSWIWDIWPYPSRRYNKLHDLSYTGVEQGVQTTCNEVRRALLDLFNRVYLFLFGLRHGIILEILVINLNCLVTQVLTSLKLPLVTVHLLVWHQSALALEIRSVNTVTSFKAKLKSHLFHIGITELW